MASLELTLFRAIYVNKLPLLLTSFASASHLRMKVTMSVGARQDCLREVVQRLQTKVIANDGAAAAKAKRRLQKEESEVSLASTQTGESDRAENFFRRPNCMRDLRRELGPGSGSLDTGARAISLRILWPLRLPERDLCAPSRTSFHFWNGI